MKINLDKLGEWAFGRDYVHPLPPTPKLTTEQQTELKERYFPGVKPLAPVPATKQLRTNLERVTLAYNDRERLLVKEIADREAGLADVRRARDATTAALIELDVDLPEIDVDAAQVEAVGAAPRIENISTDAATGEQLDALGRLYSMRRRGPNEPDDAYRERIRREHKRLTAELPA